MQILLYHEIVKGKPKEIHAVKVGQFEQHMGWLAQNGYHSVSFEDWLAARAGDRSRLPPRSVVITFDDGYLDNYQNAWPVMQKYGQCGTIYLVSTLVGRTSSWRGGELDFAPLMTWDQADEMARSGFSFGSHTATHPDLAASSLETVRDEFSRSKREIEQGLGRPVISLAYPMSRYTPQVRDLAPLAGYQAACVSPTGYVGQAGSRPFEQYRVTILANDTLETFSQKMRTTLPRRLHWYRRVAGSIKRKLLATFKG
jgi:peptidoglycan/xylan/chitin deacetylase (PgdA/CDA1 family)